MHETLRQRQLRLHRASAGMRLRRSPALILIPGLILLLIRGVNYSIEFTGGTLVQVESQGAGGRRRAARTPWTARGIHGAEIQSFGSDRES